MEINKDYGQDAIDRFKVMLNSVTLDTPRLARFDEQLSALSRTRDPLANIDGASSTFVRDELCDSRDNLSERLEDSRYRICLALQSLPQKARQEIAVIVAQYQTLDARPSGVA